MSEKRSPLDVYRAKRSGDRTGEPLGHAVPPKETAAQDGARLFVVQMHAARRMHWDLRLEIDGVLRSWAVPRGPSFDPSVKRLAVQTEDHPIEYIDFEGIIPDGNYGAGAMIVWDRGVWVPKEPIAEGYTKGKLLFELRGHKLRGVWTLVRTKGPPGSKDDGRQWLLIKKPDAAAHGAPPNDRSILSGLTIEQLREGTDRTAEFRGEVEQLAGAKAAEVEPRSLNLMLTETIAEPFTRKGWLFELKYDGYRLLAARQGEDALLRYRSGLVATHAYPEIARAVSALPYNGIVLDGEVVVLDDDARPNFQRLQKRALLLGRHDLARATREQPVTYYVFDLLAFDGYDLRAVPLVERKQVLERLLPPTGAIRFADHIPERGEALFEHVRALGLEGMVAKQADSPYLGRRSDKWLRIRIETTDDFIIIGFTEPEGTRVGLGALHLATFDGDTLVYSGRVGTGLRDTQLTELRRRLDELRVEEPPCPITIPSGRVDHWVRPQLVCEVRFRARTEELLLRLPVFVRMRDDKPARECTLPSDARTVADDAPDEPATIEATTADPNAPTHRTPDEPPDATEVPPPAPEVTISNPTKVFWPQAGYTKLDLIDYYRAISPWLLPYLRDRPLVLTRYPDGIDGKWFFQKNAPPFVPDWIKTELMWSEHESREVEYFVCNDVNSLAYVANLATIPLHVWGSRLAALPHPDWCILDLDPKGAPFADVVKIALTIHALCDAVGLPNYCKTSGSTGLHVLVPLGGQCTYEQCRMLAQILGRIVASELRDIATAERSKRAREGRVYIDYVQNGHGRLLVSPFSVRPKPGAPVSTPLLWDEVVPDLDHQRLTIANVPQRMRDLGHDPLRPVLTERPDLRGALAKLATRLED